MGGPRAMPHAAWPLLTPCPQTTTSPQLCFPINYTISCTQWVTSRIIRPHHSYLELLFIDVFILTLALSAPRLYEAARLDGGVPPAILHVRHPPCCMLLSPLLTQRPLSLPLLSLHAAQAHGKQGEEGSQLHTRRGEPKTRVS